jgi:hypothetical protein
LTFGVFTVVSIHIVVLWIQEHVAWRTVNAVAEAMARSLPFRRDRGSMFFRDSSDHLTC